jgi:glycolate oxidase FAD binding subunit
VVKNAAGFDLAKFLVGSLGQYLAIIDVTFKVFPDKTHFLTYQYDYAKPDEAMNAIFHLNRQIFELDALDLEPHLDSCSLIARFAGTPQTLQKQMERFSAALRQHSKVQTMTQLEDEAYWQGVNALKSFKGHLNIIKVPITPKHIPQFNGLRGAETYRFSVGGNILWSSDDKIQNYSGILAEHNLTGLKILGRPNYVIYGKPIDNIFTQRVKAVLDPENKFT